MLGKTAANLQAAEANWGRVPYILVIRTTCLYQTDLPFIFYSDLWEKTGRTLEESFRTR